MTLGATHGVSSAAITPTDTPTQANGGGHLPHQLVDPISNHPVVMTCDDPDRPGYFRLSPCPLSSPPSPSWRSSPISIWLATLKVVAQFDRHDA